ncbi:MAG TPA: DUF87 domain-containing protein [Candidatus Polarisedimenticolia bacterium]|nr:DUF87 domain-containing protein [Candidatus Polarisedimenticolia bacterium]
MPTNKPSPSTAAAAGGAWPPDPAVFEKLGAFYLGRALDPATQAPVAAPLLYDARDLTTHAVIVGMTGSGKTGLGIALLEEAALDGIPAIAIDPKGDLGNLMLAFPELRPADFRPWVDEGEAARAGLDPDASAARTAAAWRDGLAQWGEDGGRIARYRAAARASIYTPGARAGRPLSVLRSLAAPAAGADPEATQERIATTVAGLLALLGIESDPLRGREAILLSNLLAALGASGRSATLGDLVRGVQSPPFDRVGVLDLDTFYPSKDRQALAVALNNLLASPGFAAWTEGEPLDAKRLLYTEDGKPRLSILSIAHLSDAERMFFVTLLLNEVLAWVRTLPGTGSLRALLYMDEVFGYFPPTANPPSKPPMLTLLKQARAFGVGIVLATQNPVDLDYKGLANAGTWFLGRLQTERDKARVIEGLEGATSSRGAAFDRAAIDRTLAGLKSRVFLMSNAHEDAPALLQTRWTLSYLRGPLTRPQIQTLMAGQAGSTASAAPPDAAAAAPIGPAATEAPALPPDIPQLFAAAPGAAMLRPAILGEAKLHYVDAKNGVDEWRTVRLLAPIGPDRPAPTWSESTEAPPPSSFSTAAPAEARYASVPGPALRAKSYADWSRALSDALYQGRSLTLLRAPDLKLASKPGETPGDFQVRLRQLLRERRDAEIEKLRARYAAKIAALQEQARRADQRIEREQAQFNQQTMQTAISVGATVLGALFGRKIGSVGNVGRATTAMRGAGRSMREHEDIGQAQESADAVRGRIADLEAELKAEIEGLQSDTGPATEEITVRPRKADIAVERLALAWIPAE